ncbi:MAG: hypothetical protein ICV87_10000 [Gemmatimonadetes bacterium]|nr:hypothetical protein [Gemmatimonadota bacterium]
MRKALLLVVMLCAGLAPAHAQARDTTAHNSSPGAEITGGVLGSAAGVVVGSLAGFSVEVYGGCIEGGNCGGAALAGAVLGGTLGAAGGAYLGGKLAGHDVSFPRALGGATLGLAIFGGVALATSTVDDEIAIPFIVSIPLGQGFFAGAAAQRVRRR